MKTTKTLIILALGILMNACTITRIIRYYEADIDDYNVFPEHKLTKSDNPFQFNYANELLFDSLMEKSKDTILCDLKQHLENTTTRAFVVIRNDSVLFEEYFRGYQRDDISTFFSVSKSVTSLLIGIALDEGYIKSIDDPVTNYLEDFQTADPKFQELTIHHLLQMRSGLKFDESYESPFDLMARLYYGRNQRGKIKRMGFEYEPGEKHIYQSVSTAVLGLVLEEATGMSLDSYFDEKVWQPLRMENDASWSLDDKKHRSAKAFCGLNATAIDLAKIGRLYLNEGKFEGKQIVSKEWVEKTLTPDALNHGYQLQWYSFEAYGTDTSGNRFFDDSLSAVQCKYDKYTKYPYFRVQENNDDTWSLGIFTNQFYALGIMHQILFIDPQKKIIMVRLGDDSDKGTYLSTMFRISKVL